MAVGPGEPGVVAHLRVLRLKGFGSSLPGSWSTGLSGGTRGRRPVGVAVNDPDVVLADGDGQAARQLCSPANASSISD